MALSFTRLAINRWLILTLITICDVTLTCSLLSNPAIWNMTFCVILYH